jgi:hypothetical protein
MRPPEVQERLVIDRSRCPIEGFDAESFPDSWRSDDTVSRTPRPVFACSRT